MPGEKDTTVDRAVLEDRATAADILGAMSWEFRISKIEVGPAPK
jgi:hypothetical protein